MQNTGMTKNQRRIAIALPLLIFVFMLPLFINGMGMEHSVRRFTPMPSYVTQASVELHSWWLSALIMAGVVGGFLLLMLGRLILGLGARNAAIIFAAASIIGGATLLKQHVGTTGISYSGPRCIVIGVGGGSRGGGSAAPAAAAPAAAGPAPSSGGGV